MEASADGSRGRWVLRFLCPKRSLLSPPSASPLLWLIGAPRVLPPFTVVATLRPLHGDHAAPDLPREAGKFLTRFPTEAPIPVGPDDLTVLLCLPQTKSAVCCRAGSTSSGRCSWAARVPMRTPLALWSCPGR
ncbi:putative Ufm1-specific protease [Panicum miliaceum]|uniref:Ufm1-specific protease n=1 Tax=Panicum miliaceum TaxID=4540 RepID=A0A3L6SVR3_PANMI|nr:putative Ufm1-specific protease [Panicum miliaceum]